LNIVPTKKSEITPYEGWKGRKPSLSYLRTWGCLAKVNLPIVKKLKLGLKTIDCVFLGYAANSPAYKFLVVRSDSPDVNVDTIVESRDATFFEDIFPLKSVHNSQRDEEENSEQPKLTPSEIPQPHEEDNSETSLRKSKRERIPKSFDDDFTIYLMDDTPGSILEAFASPDADDWKEDIRSKMDSIMTNRTWEVVDHTFSCKPIGCKWMFKKKLRSDVTIEKYKARLVAKGYTQKGEDFFNTYSPVARMTIIRVLLSLAASYGLLVHQMDVKTAFLNGELDEKIYMD
jgi:hypothetical protein